MLLNIKGNYENDFNATINLEEFLPASPEKMNKLYSLFISVSDDPESNAHAVYNYIAEKVNELKEVRSHLYPENPYDKKEIAEINSKMKRYISNAAVLTKRFNFPELSDKEAQITMHAAKVFARVRSGVEAHDGWTFEKAGYTFDVYKKLENNKAHYVILLHDTGLNIASANKKSAAPAEITQQILDLLNKNRGKISATIEQFKKIKVEAGFVQEQRAEIISNDNMQEEKTMNYQFTKYTVTINGETFNAEYNITSSGSVLVFAITGSKPDGRKEKQRIKFDPDHADYSAALEAAKAYKGIADPVQKTTTEELKRDPKSSRGPVPEKTFIGETIQGTGWKIVFDGEKQRTRVIFDKDPINAVRKVLEEAGFYYSSVMNSWNKKLTFKAYRAAKELSGKLIKVCAA